MKQIQTLLVACLSAALFSGCAHLPDNSGREFSTAISESGELSPAANFLEDGYTFPDNKSGFIVLDSGLDAFVARIVSAEFAVRSIDIQTFIYKDDLVGRAVLNALVKAADKGVRVRLLLDDIWVGVTDAKLAAIDAHPNIEVRMFNPMIRKTFKKVQYITRFGKVTRRMHGKAFIIDNQVAIVGGRNIANEYYDAKPDVVFGDVDAIAIGPVVQDVSDSFDRFWNHDLSYPINILARHLPSNDEAKTVYRELAQYAADYDDSDYAKALQDSNFAKSLRNKSLKFNWADARLIADLPGKISASRDREDLWLSEEITTLFMAAKEEIIIISPYFIPGDEGTRELIELEERGVDVHVLTNSLGSNNHSSVHAYYSKYRKELIEGGVDIYEFHSLTDSVDPEKNIKQVLHAKVFIIDRKSFFIGSLNFDPRSWVENTEMGIIYENEEIGTDFGEWFDNGIGKVAYHVKLKMVEGREVLVWVDTDGNEYLKEPHLSLMKRLKLGFFRLLPLESQL